MKVTVVIEYEEGQTPEFHAHMKLHGGTVVAVQFSDALEEMESLRERLEEPRHL